MTSHTLALLTAMLPRRFKLLLSQILKLVLLLFWLLLKKLWLMLRLT